MPGAPIPADDAARVEALRALSMLDSPPEARFDRITKLAQRLFDVPIVLVSLVEQDRQWFKSNVGLDGVTETSRDVSFCAHAIMGEQVFVIPDATQDDRFAENPLVTGDPFIRFYAGAPVATPQGEKLGTLCLIDRTPRTFSEEDERALRVLADVVQQELVMQQLAAPDEATGLPTRQTFLYTGGHLLSAIRRAHAHATIVVVRAPEQDAEAMRAIAPLVQDAVRLGDLVGRTGDTEIGVLLADAGLEPPPPAERIRAALTAAGIEGALVGTTGTGPDDEMSLDALLQKAAAAAD